MTYSVFGGTLNSTLLLLLFLGAVVVVCVEYCRYILLLFLLLFTFWESFNIRAAAVVCYWWWLQIWKSTRTHGTLFRWTTSPLVCFYHLCGFDDHVKSINVVIATMHEVTVKNVFITDPKYYLLIYHSKSFFTITQCCCPHSSKKVLVFVLEDQCTSPGPWPDV